MQVEIDACPNENMRLYGRDIVQFVEFSKFRHDFAGLAKETLIEVPKQFLEFMDMNGIKPNKKEDEEVKAGALVQLGESKDA